MTGRALTPGQKRAVLDRIYAAWVSPQCEHLRLGQLIENATAGLGGVLVFYVEDEALAGAVEEFAAARRGSE